MSEQINSPPMPVGRLADRDRLQFRGWASRRNLGVPLTVEGRLLPKH